MESQVAGSDLLRMLETARRWLGFHRDLLNEQNVYPVPDGDTGTNMLLTLNASCQAMSDASGDETVRQLWSAAAQGALAGSRGNSGVILSQLLRGMAEGMNDGFHLHAAGLRSALRRGSEEAYRSVSEPQEGTILSVARAAAAASAACSAADLEETLASALQGAQEAVERTPEQLPVLKRAGVVDAGGLGLSYFLEGLLKGLLAEHVEPLEGALAQSPGPDSLKPLQEIPQQLHGFDVQFLSHSPVLTVESMRHTVESMGTHALVEGSSELVKVHVHVEDPGPVLSWGCAHGFITDVVVENMDAMSARAQGDRPVRQLDRPAEGRVRLLHAAAEHEAAVVAVSPSSGFSDLFESLGVNCLIECSDTLNPSVTQFEEAMACSGGSLVALLPNHANAMAAARQAAAVRNAAGQKAFVIETPFVLNGVAAMYAFEPATDPDRLLEDMQNQASKLLHCSVTRASRPASGPRGPVSPGDYVALAWARDVLGGGSELEAALDISMTEFLLPRLADEDAEQYSLLTLYQGAEFDAGRSRTREALQRFLPDFEIEWVDSGQKHHQLLIAVE